jgi:heme/copper-type cytochrome/quinol oxidase subunit 3
MTLTKRDFWRLVVAGTILVVGFGAAFSIRFVYRKEALQFLGSLFGDNLMLISAVGLIGSGLGFAAFLRSGSRTEESEFSSNTIRAVIMGLIFVTMLFSLFVASVI